MTTDHRVTVITDPQLDRRDAANTAPRLAVEPTIATIVLQPGMEITERRVATKSLAVRTDFLVVRHRRALTVPQLAALVLEGLQTMLNGESA